MSSGFFTAEPAKFLLVYGKLKKGRKCALSTIGIKPHVSGTENLEPSAKAAGSLAEPWQSTQT